MGGVCRTYVSAAHMEKNIKKKKRTVCGLDIRLLYPGKSALPDFPDEKRPVS
jgi:hypothetical protein